MAPTITTQTHPLVFNQEVSFGTIAGGPFDFLDVFVDMSANPDADAVTAEWRIYATVGALVSLVATAPGGGARPSVLEWAVGGFQPSTDQQAPHSPARASGTVYELRAFVQADIPIGPPPVATASLIGYDEFDIAADTSVASGLVALPANGTEVVLGAALGYAHLADCSVDQTTFNTPVQFTLYALAGGGGVLAEVQRIVLNGGAQIGSPPTRIFSPTNLPGATIYTLRARTLGGVGANVSASLGTVSSNVSVGGVVALSGNANGPSNANHVEAFGIPGGAVDRNIVAADFAPIAPGIWYAGFSGLTANRTATIPDTVPSGAQIILADEDGSLANFTMTVAGSTGKTIDGNANFIMNGAMPGPKGTLQVMMNFDAPTEWKSI